MSKAIDVECPRCLARPGEQCTTLSPPLRSRSPHDDRVKVAAGARPPAPVRLFE